MHEYPDKCPECGSPTAHTLMGYEPGQPDENLVRCTNMDCRTTLGKVCDFEPQSGMEASVSYNPLDDTITLKIQDGDKTLYGSVPYLETIDIRGSLHTRTATQTELKEGPKSP